MSQLPQDPMILLSYVNTQLRDHYASLEEFCASEGADCEEIVKKLRDVDYEYDPETNVLQAYLQIVQGKKAASGTEKPEAVFCGTAAKLV